MKPYKPRRIYPGLPKISRVKTTLYTTSLSRVNSLINQVFLIFHFLNCDKSCFLSHKCIDKMHFLGASDQEDSPAVHGRLRSFHCYPYRSSSLIYSVHPKMRKVAHLYLQHFWASKRHKNSYRQSCGVPIGGQLEDFGYQHLIGNGASSSNRLEKRDPFARLTFIKYLPS